VGFFSVTCPILPAFSQDQTYENTAAEMLWPSQVASAQGSRETRDGVSRPEAPMAPRRFSKSLDPIRASLTRSRTQSLIPARLPETSNRLSCPHSVSVKHWESRKCCSL